jgi:hypothetical protein
VRVAGLLVAWSIIDHTNHAGCIQGIVTFQANGSLAHLVPQSEVSEPKKVVPLIYIEEEEQEQEQEQESTSAPRV